MQIDLAIIIYLAIQYKKDRKTLYMLVISAYWCLVAEITANMTFFYCLSQRDSLSGAICYITSQGSKRSVTIRPVRKNAIAFFSSKYPCILSIQFCTFAFLFQGRNDFIPMYYRQRKKPMRRVGILKIIHVRHCFYLSVSKPVFYFCTCDCSSSVHVHDF